MRSHTILQFGHTTLTLIAHHMENMRGFLSCSQHLLYSPTLPSTLNLAAIVSSQLPSTLLPLEPIHALCLHLGLDGIGALVSVRLHGRVGILAFLQIIRGPGLILLTLHSAITLWSSPVSQAHMSAVCLPPSSSRNAHQLAPNEHIDQLCEGVTGDIRNCMHIHVQRVFPYHGAHRVVRK